MDQADSTPAELFKPLGENPEELTRVSEIIRESGIPVADSVKDEMFAELVRLTQEDAGNVYEDDRQRSA